MMTRTLVRHRTVRCCVPTASLRSALAFATLAVLLCAAPGSAQTIASNTALTVTAGLGFVQVFTAQVTVGGHAAVGGTVTFFDGTRAVGTAQVVASGNAAGTATFRQAVLAGIHGFSAAYSGAPNGAQRAAGSQSAPVFFSLNVTGESSTTTLSSQPDAAHPGDYQLTATVSAFGLAAPLGSVTFTDSSTHLTLGSAGLANPALSQRFLPPATFPYPGYTATSVFAADLNQDGLTDFAVTDEGFNEVCVFLSDASSPGTLLPAACYATGNSPFFVVAGDVNADGIPDLIVANDADRTVGVLLGDPAHPGQFLTQVTYATGFLPTGIAIDDFNRDGVPDLAVANRGDGTVGILLGDPAHPGQFLAQVTYATGQGPWVVASADLNGDGYPDLATSNYNSDNISVLLADPTHPGTFLPQQLYPLASGALPFAITLADLNGDSKPDIVVGAGNGTLDVLLADPAHPGQFLAPATYLLSGYPMQTFVAVGDINGDGIPDVVVTSGDLDVFLGDPAHPGSLLAPVVYPAVKGPMAEGDANGDGAPDLLVVDSPVSITALMINSLQASETAVLSGVALPAEGLHALTANYSGTAADRASSTSVTVSVPWPSTTALSIQPATAALGSVIQLSASVSVNGHAAASGNVRFFDGKRLLGTAAVTPTGAAVLKTQSFTAGSHSLTAAYSGAPYSTQAAGPSVSASATLAITGPALAATFLMEAADTTNPSNVDLTATVQGFSFSAPTGTVSFDNPTTGQMLGTVALTPGSTSFLLEGSFPVGFDTGTAVTADFNGDGFPDVAVLDVAEFTVLLGDPSHPGKLGAPTVYPTFQGGYYMTAADVNGDGLPDLVQADWWGNSVDVILNDPQHPGKFLPITTYPAGALPSFVVTGDFNQDGWPDVAVINSGDKTIAILFADPAHPGQYLPQVVIATNSAASQLLVGDFNRDGIPDIAVVDGGLSIYFSDPNNPGKFLPPVSLNVTATAAVAGDFNGDGLLDLAAFSTTLNVLLADAAHPGQFLAPVSNSLPIPQSPRAFAVADFNGDGRDDLAVTTAVLLSDAQHPGQFLSTPVLVPSGYTLELTSLVVADFNGDGVPDLASESYGPNNMLIWLGGASSTASLMNVAITSYPPQVLNASYNGDETYSAGTSNHVPGQVPQATTTTLTTTPSIINFGGIVTLTATVTMGQTPVTAGTVSFQLVNGSLPPVVLRTLATVQLVSSGPNAGTAAYSTWSFSAAAGTNSPASQQIVIATYNGAPGAAPSSSGTNGVSILTQVLPSITLTVQANAVDPANYDFTVVLQGAEVAPPTGSVYIENLTNYWADSPSPPVPPAPVTYLPAVTYGVAAGPRAVLSGDFNGDGIPDMVVADQAGNAVSVLLGDPAHRGQLLPAVTYSLPMGFAPSALAAGDFNRDGLPDIAVAGASNTAILLSVSSTPGSFSLGSATYPGGTLVATADFNNDGYADLITGPSSNALVNLFLGGPQHPGQFTAGIAPVAAAAAGFTPVSVAAADFNGDGSFDLAIGFVSPAPSVGAASNGYLSILMGDPLRPGRFLAPTNSAEAGIIPQSVIAASFVAAGETDLLVNGNLLLLADSANPGSFLAPASLGTAASGTVAVADLNGDGLLDIAALGSSNATILLADAANPGKFLAPVTEGITGTALALGDWNGDAKADLAVASAATQNVSVLLSSSISIVSTLTDVFLLGRTDVQQNVVAVYPGDSNYVSSQSPALLLYGSGTYSVQLTLIPSALSVHTGGTLAFGIASGPKGTYSLSDNGVQVATLTGTYPIFSETFMTAGLHNITVSFSGDDTYSPAQTSPLTVTVWSFSVTPNPIPVASGSSKGSARIDWNFPQASTIEIHAGSPSGPLVAAGASAGSLASTGATLSDGEVLYAQDTTAGKPLTGANTLATAAVRLSVAPSSPSNRSRFKGHS